MRFAVVLSAVAVAACAPSASPTQCAPVPSQPPAPLSVSAATPVYFLAAIRSNDAALVEELLRASRGLAETKTERGASALLLALFRLKDKEGFFRPQDN